MQLISLHIPTDMLLFLPNVIHSRFQKLICFFHPNIAGKVIQKQFSNISKFADFILFFHLSVSLERFSCINSFVNLLSANPAKQSNTLKQFVDQQTNCLSMFDHLVGQVFKGLMFINTFVQKKYDVVSEVYLEPCQISILDVVVKIVNVFSLYPIFS